MEGHREIEAAKLRLAAAKKQMSSATQMMEAARKLMDAARKEVEDAESFLKETEDRLEVIDVDVVADSQGSKKRRKLSMSSERSDRVPVDNNDSAAVFGTTAISATSQSNGSDNSAARRTNTVQTGVQGNALEQRRAEFEAAVDKHRDDTLQLLRESGIMGESSIPTETMLKARTKNLVMIRAANIMASRFGGIKLTDAELTTRFSKAENDAVILYTKELSIVVSGCGILGANGKYNRSSTKLNDGVPWYRKNGKWNEKIVSFVICRKASRSGPKCWVIYVAGSRPTPILYKAPNNTDSWLPPSDGWVATGGGINPAPKLKL